MPLVAGSSVVSDSNHRKWHPKVFFVILHLVSGEHLIGGLDWWFGDLNPWCLQRVDRKPP